MIEHWSSPEDAALKACALMIKGICMTKPQDEWTALIEKRIQFMLKSAERADADTAGASDAYRKALAAVAHSRTIYEAETYLQKLLDESLAAGASNERADVEKDAALTELLNDHIELNMSNYNEDDVSALNEWAIRAYAILAAKEKKS